MFAEVVVCLFELITLPDGGVASRRAELILQKILLACDSSTTDLELDYDGQLDDTIVPGQLGRLSRVRGDGWSRTTTFDALDRVTRRGHQLDGLA
jgi:hypothetical protein